MFHLFERVESIHGSQTRFSIFLNNYQFSFFFCNALILKPGLHIKKMSLREISKIYQNIQPRYIQYKYTFLHNVFNKCIVATLFFPVVCFQTVKDARWKMKIRDTLIL